MNDLESRFLTLKNKQTILQKDLDDNTEKAKALKRTLSRIEEAQIIIQKASKDVTESVKEVVTEMSSEALSSLLGKDRKIKITFQTRGKQNLTLEADLKLVDEFGHETNMAKSNGGGVRDFVSMLLRCAMLEIIEPEENSNETYRKILIVDEPLTNVSEDKRDLAGYLLKEIAEKLNIQILMTSNENEYIAISDKTIDVTQYSLTIY